MTATAIATTATAGLLPGFSDPVLDSQRVFRAVLDVMSRPGTVVELPLRLAAPMPLDAAATAVALALTDHETHVWLDRAANTEAVRQYLRFHCGCPLTGETVAADFAIVADARSMPPLSDFKLGSDEFPDRSTTLIVQVPTLTAGEPWNLKGPGIRDRKRLAVGGLPSGFHRWVADNHDRFPRGIDLIFTSGCLLTALPRTVRLEG
ncbi:MAG TPA: phosphonate C-P lyase system protein PhnH [Azospirillum sp.]|nr:phosphonate C-P lyase system protein PhnH [Azospirillum sp.]